MNFSCKLSDRNFNLSVPVPLTNKQKRIIKRKPKAGDKNSPLMLFWKFFQENSNGVDVELATGSSRFMVSENTYNMLREQTERWMLKEVTYLTPGSPAHQTAVGMYMLNYGPTDVTHPKVKDGVVYYLDKLQGMLDE